LGAQRRFADLGDRQRGGVRREDRVARGGGVELGEHALLDVHALGHRLDHEVDVAEGLIRGRAVDAVEDLLSLGVGLLGGDLAALGEFADLPARDVRGLLQPGLHERLVDVLEHHGDARGGDRLGDLPAHGSSADDRCLRYEHAWISSLWAREPSDARVRPHLQPGGRVGCAGRCAETAEMGKETDMRAVRGADGTHPAGSRRRSWTAVAFAAFALAVAAGGWTAASASAAAPKATTGGAKDVSYGAATVAGTINPGGEATSYYFQYGPTHAYGGQTGIGSAGAGGKGVPVAVGLMGLQPLTVYHYRLVAVNGAGTSFGQDRTFQTTKVPLSLSILSSPNPALYGGPIVIQGTLSGTGNAGRQVVLEGRPWPFNAPFAPIGNPELTTATGSFSFTLLGSPSSMQFQVVTTTKPVVASLVATESVAVRVS